MPLFFNLTDPRGDPQTQPASRWYQPMLFYLVALAVRLFGFGEAVVRLPGVLIAILDAFLIYAVARRLFVGRTLPALAASLLILCPVHVILTRQATDYICPLPFVLGWLWCTLKSNDEDSAALAFAAGLLLGIGFYSHLAAVDHDAGVPRPDIGSRNVSRHDTQADGDGHDGRVCVTACAARSLAMVAS
jgi:hypothetical protein